MLELAGYFDGANVQILDGVRGIRKNQRVKILVMNDFFDTDQPATTEKSCEKAKMAYERLLSHARPGIGSGDYKADLREMLEKKYEAIG